MLAYNEYLYLDGVLLDGVLGPFNGTGVDNALVRWDGTNYRNIQECPGITVDDSGHLTSAGNILAATFDTNVAAAGVTLSGTTLAADGTDADINIAITPKGTGEVDITKVDIDSGTIDGCTIMTSDITVGAGKTLDVSLGTLTLANDQISGDKIEGGTIAGITINDLVVSTSLGVGVVSPCSLVEIWDDDAHPILSITAAHATDYDPQIQFRTDVTDTVKCSMGVDSGDSDKFKIYMGEGIGDTSQFVFTSAGYLGIGTEVPEALIHGKVSGIVFKGERTTTAQAVVNSSFFLKTRSTGDISDGFGGGIVFLIGDATSAEEAIATIYGIRDTADDSGALTFNTYDTGVRSEHMRITHDGRVGIGETAPGTLVEMTHDSPFFIFHCDTESDAADSGLCKLIFKREQLNGTESTHAAIYAAHELSNADQKGYIALCTNDGSDGASPTEAMRINSLRYVGIRTNDPQVPLHVVKDSFSNIHFALYTVQAVQGAEGRFQFIAQDSGSAAGMMLFTNVPTSGNNKHWVLHHEGPTTNNNFSLGYMTSAATDFEPNSATRMFTMTTGGIMGLGVTTPTAGGFEIYKALAAPDDLGDFDNYQLVVRGHSDTGDTAGILLSTSLDTYGGSAIVHYDTGAGGQGDLVFYVKQDTGAVPPVECMRLSHTNGNVGIGVTSPTAYLHIKAGTATASTAPVKLTNGTLLGTPEAGAIEYSLEKFWITNVSTQRVIDRSSCVITETTTVSNTTDETEIYNCPIAGNGLRAGNHVHVGVSGLISNDSAADDITVRLYIGSTLISTYNPAIGNITDADWHAEIQITTRSIGATGSVAVHGHVIIDDNEDHVISVETVDTTATCDLSITVEWDNAKATNIISAILGASHWSN